MRKSVIFLVFFATLVCSLFTSAQADLQYISEVAQIVTGFGEIFKTDFFVAGLTAIINLFMEFFKRLFPDMTPTLPTLRSLESFTLPTLFPKN